MREKNLLHPWNMSAEQFRPASKQSLTINQSLPLAASPLLPRGAALPATAVPKLCRGSMHKSSRSMLPLLLVALPQLCKFQQLADVCKTFLAETGVTTTCQPPPRAKRTFGCFSVRPISRVHQKHKRTGIDVTVPSTIFRCPSMPIGATPKSNNGRVLTVATRA